MKTSAQVIAWKGPERSIPRELIKCGLFSVKASKAREGSVKSLVIMSETNKSGSTLVKYTGWGLNQCDLDVYLELLEFGRKSIAGELVYFTRSELLHALGWPMQTRYRKKLITCLEHLRRTSINGNVIRYVGNNETTNLKFDFSLVSEFFIYETDEGGDDTGRISRDWSIVLPHGLNKIFAGGGAARIDIQERKSLKGNSLAKFIHAYLASNKYDGRFTPNAKELHQLSGSTRKKLNDFKYQELQKAIDCINDANISYKVCMNKITGRLAKMMRSEHE
jgi:hypothetical protein